MASKELSAIFDRVRIREGKVIGREGLNGLALFDYLEDNEHLVQLHVGDIKTIMGYIQALALRLARIEDRLGITEPVVVPGD